VWSRVLQAIPNVPRLTEGLNPATWMLQVSTPGMESAIGADFAEIYRSSELYKCATPPLHLLFLTFIVGVWTVLAALTPCRPSAGDALLSALIRPRGPGKVVCHS
jgi:hypothetical protein